MKKERLRFLSTLDKNIIYLYSKAVVEFGRPIINFQKQQAQLKTNEINDSIL